MEKGLKKVGIIGGGITGLIAAYRLQKNGLEPIVFEATDRVGGVIKSVRTNSYLADLGPNAILETTLQFKELFSELGLGEQLLYSRPDAENRYLVRYGRPIALPLSFIKFFSSPLFSLSAKLTLLKEPFIPKRNDDQDETVADLVLRRLNREWLDYAINPLVAGIYAGRPEVLSVKYGFPRLYEAERKYGSLILAQILGAKDRRKEGRIPKYSAKKLSFEEGLEVLPRRIKELLGEQIKLKHRVIEITYVSKGWIITSITNNEPKKYNVNAVLLAAPAYELEKITLNGKKFLNPLGKIYYPPVASVVLGFRRRDVGHPLDGFGMLVPEKEPFQILGTLFSSSIFEGRALDGYVTLTTYLGGSRNPELALLPEDKLISITLKDLKILLNINGHPRFELCGIYEKAIPQYELGYERIIGFISDLEQIYPGLFFAGHYKDGISVSDCILSGINVADRITSFLATYEVNP